ncbi:hypothetical protein ES703_78604 [subsurface metagenome]
MTFQKAVEILNDYINHGLIVNEEDFMRVLVMSREALVGLRELERSILEADKTALLT